MDAADRWQQVSRLYSAARSREGSARAAFLREACGDDSALRRDVESLLAGVGPNPEQFERAAKEPDEAGSNSLIGRRLGVYELQSLIGAGGMGEVYRAHDPRLGRDVAIKILPRAFTGDPDRLARFDREARALAALNHSHIGAIYGVEDADGERVLVLELVEGETLADKLGQGPLPLAEALRIARQIADGLDAAHEKGIVHRDLKPANIKVTPSGLVKVLDFGLAKRVATDAASSGFAESPTETVGGTRAGIVLGTVAYMSPEQARGQVVDKRTDIWAFGCLLYEMLTGQSAFERDTVTDTLAAIVDQEVNWDALPETTPPEVLRLLRRCLEKDRKRRFASAADVRLEVDEASAEPSPRARVGVGNGGTRPVRLTRRRAIGLGTAAAVSVGAGVTAWRMTARDTGIRSLAVLPFANAAHDEDAEYLCDGITGSLIDRISRLPSLRVMARSTVFAFKGKTIDPRAVGRQLAVSAILTGTVTRRSDRLVITAELVDVATGAQLWGERYDRAAADLLSVQDAITKAIVEDGIRLRLTGEERRRLARSPTGNKDAYDLYLRALQSMSRETEQDYLRAREILERVVALDKDFSLAYAALGDTYAVMAIDGYERPTEAWPKAKQSLARALELEPDLPNAHVALGSQAFFFDWDWQSADREFRSVIGSAATGSLDQEVVKLVALERWALGRQDDALTIVRKARELDQFSFRLMILEADLLLQAQRFEKAAVLYEKVTRDEPGDSRAFFGLADTRRAQGRFADAIEARRRGHAAAGDDSLRDVLATARGGDGYRRIELATARLQLDDLQNRAAAGAYVSPLDFARVHAQLGDTDEAFRWLFAAFEDRVPGLVFLKVDRAWDGVRNDARFLVAVRRIGLP